MKIHFEVIYKDGTLCHKRLTEKEAIDLSNDTFVKSVYHPDNPYHPINNETIPKYY